MPFQFTCERCGASFSRDSRPTKAHSHRFCSMTCRDAPRPGIQGPDGSILVPLTRGKFATIDAQDADEVLAYRWSAFWDGGAGEKRLGPLGSV